MIDLDLALCKGCGICIAFCPVGVFDTSESMSERGTYPVVVSRPDKCVDCGLCELLCPDLAIIVVDEGGG